MSAAKIPAIRERMRRQEILARELGGVPVETRNRMAVAGERGPERAQLRIIGRHKPASRIAGSANQKPYDRGNNPRARPGLPGFASLIRKVIAY